MLSGEKSLEKAVNPVTWGKWVGKPTSIMPNSV